ncbi:hypothetical protein L1286_23865, partial [Pseudoalteromonas sp. SMS1]|uniref:hypothetical protein n=1 Tax=Pseudoalteromonas sp. SMS1 TaxID=2908894 RepID=UPI001F45D4FB
ALVSLTKGTSQGAGELGVERIYRDAQGRAVATEDAEGARSYVLYDAAGRKRFTVDALGAVTEFEYDKANQVIATTQFATLVNTSSWLNAAGELTVSGESFYATPNAEQDRQTLYVYNKAGQKAYEIDAQGYATRFEYNDKGQLSAKTQLSEQVTNQVIKRFNDPANSGDWYIYSNSSGKADFKAEHDASYGADVIISITSGLADGIRMDNLSKIGNRLSWDMNFAPSEKYQIYISVATQKGHRYLFYTPTNHYVSGSSEPFQRDAYLNFPLGESSRAGEWVHISRDLESDLKALEPDNALIDFNGFLIRGTGKIGAITNSNLSTEMLDSIIETDNDRKQTYHYDTAGNLEYQIDAEGYVTRHYYDAAGNQIATRQYKNKGAIGALVESTGDRVSHQFYNGQGQVIGSLDADGALTTYQYNDNGQKVVESVYLRQVQNHVVGNPLILPVGERVSSVWTYTDTGKIQSLAHSDGTYTYYTYDNMDNLVEKEVFEDRPPSIYNEQTIVDDNFNAGNVSDFTIKNDSLNSITTEGERVRFERLPASQPSWPTLAAKESYDLKDTFNIQFEVTTGASLSDTYFYGGLENLGSRGSTLDRHAIFFRGNEVQSIVARDGVEEPAKPLMHLTPNTTYVVRFESNGDSVTLIVKPKDKPEQAVSVTESSGNFTGKAHVNFYNNLYPSAENSVIYFDNYSVTKPAEAESSGISDNFDSGVMSQFTSQGDSINSISVVDGRVRFTRASASSSLWPSITSKERYTLNEPATIQFEVTTSDSLNDSYLNGGLDNLGTRSNNTLDRHAVQFDGGVIQSYVVRNGVEYGHKHMMNMTTNTTYVVRFETLKGKTVLTVMPKGQPEQAISVTESSEGFSKYAHILLFNNPRPGAQGTEIFLDNYTAESASIVSREKYRYDLLGRKVSTIDEAEQYNTPANPANWEIYDAIPSGPTISTVYDKVYGTDVIKLQGDSTHNGYKLKSEGLKNWNSKLSNIRWDIKNNEGFTVYISLQTELGHRFLRYAQGSFTPKQEGEYISHPLSGDTALGNWVTIERNLLADLKALEPDNDILTVNAFLTRGSSLV